jgi:4-hydroxyphenylacetate 3-monooxygenase
MTGTGGFRGVQTRVGKLICLRNLFWTCVDSMVENPASWPDGTCVPNPDAASVYRLMMTYPRAKEIFQQDIASSLVYLPSSGGLEGAGAARQPRPVRARLGRPLGRGAHQGHEAHLGCGRFRVRWPPRAVRAQLRGQPREHPAGGYLGQLGSGQIDGYRAMVERCTAEYDLDGWTMPDLIGPDDVSVHSRPVA